MKIRILSWLVLFLASSSLNANPVDTGNLQAQLHSVPSQIAPGDTFTLLLEHNIRPGWHTYWRNPGDSGAPTELTWRGPAGFEFGDIAWPYPERIPYGPLMNYGYHDRVIYPITVTAPDNLTGDSVVFDVKGEWLVCADVCIPERGELQLEVPVGPELIIDPDRREMEITARSKIPQYLPVKAQTRVEDDTISLSIEMPDLVPDRVKQASYFPFTEAVIDHAAAQEVAVTAEGIRFELKTGYDYTPDASFAGVVVIEEEAGEIRQTAFEVRPDQAVGAAPSGPIEADLSLATALLFAFIGGLILNLMPCVFPVLSIKVLSLMGETEHLRGHGWMYLLGVVLSFLAIAGLLIGLRAGGAEIGWGFQLQSPWVVGLLVYLFLLVGLNLSGYFEIGTRLMSLGSSSVESSSGYSGSFFTGVLATLVAAPCTAPFMASAIGYALTQSNTAALLIFLFLGLGMAAPYLLLCYSPALLQRLPQPGGWMVRFKEFLAFPLYASAVWLLWVLSLQTGATGVLVIGAGAVLLVLGIWLLKHLPAGSLPRRGLQTLALVLFAAAVYGPTDLQATGVVSSEAPVPVQGRNPAEVYSETRLEAYRASGPVFVNFTAAWCVTCKVNEAVALNTSQIADAFADKGVRYLKGDWTNEDPEITRKLEAHGRSGVPLYLLYPGGQQPPVVLPQLLTPDVVQGYLQRLP